VPEPLIAFLESSDYEGAVRNTVPLGGDADTMACIADGVAQACYGTFPQPVAAEVQTRLPQDF
jgi:ADP-ribosyl-[dinitrogen reductase] hydrolase